MSAKVVMHGFKTDDITFVNHLEPNKKIRLSFRFTHNLSYAPQNNARAEFTVVGEDAEAPDRFRISVKETGFFTYSPDLPREQVHIETFRQLFPYVRALCTTITAASGIPPIMLPQFEITEENIYQVSFRPPEQNGGGEGTDRKA